MKGAMDSHLDLSFLTEDEYQAVLKVIQRDSELKKRDGERIRTAEKSIQDEKRRKLITGRWFDEVKAKRYRNSLPGVDLIKTSIRRKKPITYEPTEKTESQQAHLSPSFPIPKLSQTTKYKDTSVSTDEASEEAPGEEEKIPARRKMKVKPVFQQDTQKKSLYDPWESSSDEPSSTEVGGRTEEKGQQRDTGPNTSSPITEPTSDWQKQTKNVHTHHPQSCQTPTGSDITTDLQIRCTSSVSRIPRRINSMGTSGDLGRTGELTAPNANIVGHGHINGQIPVVSSVESPTCEQTPDLMKQGSVAGSHCDRTQAYQAAELGGQRIASTDDNTLITRAQSNLDVTEETCKALEELEHRHLNGQGFATVSTVALPMSEKALNVPKPKRSVATHYKGAPSYQIPEASAKGKMATSNATRIPKWKSSSRESETLSTDKPESLATEPGPEGLPLIPANEAHKAPEKLDLSPTSRIPRPKIASEAAAETPKAPVEDLEPASRQLAGKNGTAEMTNQAKAAFQPTSRIAKYQPSSSDDEREQSHKPAFTIHSLGNKHPEEEILTDPGHFKNLRKFWEIGIESSKAKTELPSDVSKIPSRRLRSPEYKSCPTEINHSTLAESRSNMVTREIHPVNSFLKSEHQGNQSESQSSAEEEMVPLTKVSKLPPVPAPRLKPPDKMGKNDARMTTRDKHAEINPSMVDEVPKAVVQRTSSNDDQAKDSLVPESFEHGSSTTLTLSNNSSWDECLSNMKNSQTTSDFVIEKTIKKEILPPKENERKEMYNKIRKMAAESAPVEEFTMRKAEDEACDEKPILPDNHKAEMRNPVDSYTIRLDRECQLVPNQRNEEITLSSSKSNIPLLEQEAVPVNNVCTNISLKSQGEALVDKSPEDDVTDPNTILKYNKNTVPRGASEESKSLCRNEHSGDSGVTASSTDEPHYSVNVNPIVNGKRLTFTGTHGDEDDLSGNAVNNNSRVQEEESSNSVHSMDDSESNDDFQSMESGPTYGLSPVMRALARAKKSNAKSMDNLSSTMDRETITTSVIENEMKSDADDKAPAANLPTLEHTRVKELSKSVPLLVTESESDSASEVSFNVGWHRKSPSDASHSSDMASVSSVSGSIMSVYSGDFGSIDAQGSVQFALDYSEKNKEFQIYVSQCKDLAVVDEKKGRTDAYVKTYLLPDKARMGKRKTSVKRRNLNPLYNEILKYKIEKSVLLIQKLNLSVWHNDTLGRNSFLGEVEVDLASWDWSNRELNWYLLKSRCPAVGVGIDHRGEINLAIKYIPPSTLGAGDPPTGEVHIWMKNARDLPQLRSSGVDSFVKCYVLPDTSKKSYQKTRIVKKDTNPIYNHTIVYDGFRPEDLKEACVELTVWDHEKLTNHFLGGLRLGFGTGCSYGIPVEWMDSTEEEVALWHEMVFNPNEWIPGSLLLRPQLGGKKLK
ncbi:synaptotagmin-like protein 2 isoform X1 [Scyliorhinus canicula]|uniref:synaptotagmin-like protein 2 isoform X1 n=1 Tax=Scyliorhinus canicula TaxID=7830 RepID=UPI0018F43545|nr:synaptotagmin-like protein 2 isoform X1 [Scyliorhinus canicula]XP_038631216.1 synaptotagmin-like protein 2 isoform X1 [Scyliorhinus canicula]